MSQSVLIAVIALGGPLVGFLGSVLGSVFFPWIRERVERKRLATEQVRDLLWEFLDAAQGVFYERTPGPERMEKLSRLHNVAYRLETLLSGNDRPIADIVTSTVLRLVPVAGNEGAAALTAFRKFTARWLNGSINPEQAITYFNLELAG